jgi:hypothetical protein
VVDNQSQQNIQSHIIEKPLSPVIQPIVVESKRVETVRVSNAEHLTATSVAKKEESPVQIGPKSDINETKVAYLEPKTPKSIELKPVQETLPKETTLKPINQVCPDTIDAVCGADRKNYENRCWANHLNVRVIYAGLCISLECLCSSRINSVCGSNGKTYPNECTAKCLNVRQFTNGACQNINTAIRS